MRTTAIIVLAVVAAVALSHADHDSSRTLSESPLQAEEERDLKGMSASDVLKYKQGLAQRAQDKMVEKRTSKGDSDDAELVRRMDEEGFEEEEEDE